MMMISKMEVIILETEEVLLNHEQAISKDLMLMVVKHLFDITVAAVAAVAVVAVVESVIVFEVVKLDFLVNLFEIVSLQF